MQHPHDDDWDEAQYDTTAAVVPPRPISSAWALDLYDTRAAATLPSGRDAYDSVVVPTARPRGGTGAVRHALDAEGYVADVAPPGGVYGMGVSAEGRIAVTALVGPADRARTNADHETRL